eukprot:gene9362-11096_t
MTGSALGVMTGGALGVMTGSALGVMTGGALGVMTGGALGVMTGSALGVMQKLMAQEAITASQQYKVFQKSAELHSFHNLLKGKEQALSDDKKSKVRDEILNLYKKVEDQMKAVGMESKRSKFLKNGTAVSTIIEAVTVDKEKAEKDEAVKKLCLSAGATKNTMLIRQCRRLGHSTNSKLYIAQAVTEAGGLGAGRGHQIDLEKQAEDFAFRERLIAASLEEDAKEMAEKEKRAVVEKKKNERAPSESEAQANATNTTKAEEAALEPPVPEECNEFCQKIIAMSEAGQKLSKSKKGTSEAKEMSRYPPAGNTVDRSRAASDLMMKDMVGLEEELERGMHGFGGERK